MARRGRIGKRRAVIDTGAPLVLLDDARGEGAAAARLYTQPVEVVEASNPTDVSPALEKLRQARARGLHAVGFLSYEAGHALEAKLAPLRVGPPEGAAPLLWFGLFEKFEKIASGDVTRLLPNAASACAAPVEPLIQRDAYLAAVARAKAHIAAGDIYQANLSFRAGVRTAGNPLALYAAIRPRASAGYGAIVFTGEHWLLSFSPELFFTLEGGRLTTRPMKGTAERHPAAATDAAAAEALRADPKQRAENLMIVDLLRNDLSRVSRAGTVEVPALFTVETYPTVHQMTSTVTSKLEEGLDAIDVIEAIFPCGSITGAPKIRAMEIISDLEQVPRGPYTGAIGRLDARGDAAFNVAIRTLTMKAGEDRALIGLGSGIVADSEAMSEWRECLAKGAFVSDPERRFDLIETMRYDPQEGIGDLDRHMGRIKASADALGFAFDRHGARNELQAATFPLREPRMIRLLLSPTGAIAIEVRPLPKNPPKPPALAVVPLPVAADDFRLRHKTSDRGFYENARAAAGGFEVVFTDGAGFVTEGSFTNIFVERRGRLATPPLARGLFPGVLRARLIDEGRAEEADLVAADLVHGFYVGNSVRGLVRATLRPS